MEQFCSNRTRRVLLSFVSAVVGAVLFASGPAPANAQGSGESILNQLLREHRRQPVTLDLSPGDKLGTYAQQCQEATGIALPATLDCDAGVKVPGQGETPRGEACDHPNVLNSVCDPGSRFQVLAGRTADAVAVLHCRKNGQPKEGKLFNDIAIIVHNKANGAVCFFQALKDDMPGQAIPSPAKGDAALWADQRQYWLSPSATRAMGCIGCHDNGGFVRSNYIAQLRTPPHAMPNEADGFNNAVSPLRYVGVEFASDRSWSIKTQNAPGDSGPSCASCHRLAVNNFKSNPPRDLGTAINFALQATGATQTSKNPHSPTSPIWMRPGQVLYDSAAEATARRFHDCAAGFKASSFTAAPAGCEVKPLGINWTPPPGPPARKSPMAPIIEYLLN